MRKGKGTKGDCLALAGATGWTMVPFAEKWAAIPLGGVCPCVRSSYSYIPTVYPPQHLLRHPTLTSGSGSFFKSSAQELAPQRSLITPSPTQRHTVLYTSLACRVYACALTTMSFHGWLAGLSPPLDHKDGKHGGLLIPIFQARTVSAHGPQQMFAKRNEATCMVLVVAIMPPSCHLAISFDI